MSVLDYKKDNEAFKKAQNNLSLIQWRQKYTSVKKQNRFQSCYRWWFCPWKKRYGHCIPLHCSPFQNLRVQSTRTITSVTHHQFLPTSSLYSSPLLSRQSIPLFHTFALSAFTLRTNLCLYILNLFWHFTHTAIAPSTLPNTAHRVTEAESTQWHVCEQVQEFSEQKQVPVCMEGHTKTQRVHTLPVWEPSHPRSRSENHICLYTYAQF